MAAEEEVHEPFLYREIRYWFLSAFCFFIITVTVLDSFKTVTLIKTATAKNIVDVTYIGVIKYLYFS